MNRLIRYINMNHCVLQLSEILEMFLSRNHTSCKYRTYKSKCSVRRPSAKISYFIWSSCLHVLVADHLRLGSFWKPLPRSIRISGDIYSTNQQTKIHYGVITHGFRPCDHAKYKQRNYYGGDNNYSCASYQSPVILMMPIPILKGNFLLITTT